MNEYGWVSLVALIGWLVLALGAWRSHRINARKTIVFALVWGSIFLLVVAVFSSVQ